MNTSKLVALFPGLDAKMPSYQNIVTNAPCLVTICKQIMGTKEATRASWMSTYLHGVANCDQSIIICNQILNNVNITATSVELTQNCGNTNPTTPVDNIPVDNVPVDNTPPTAAPIPTMPPTTIAIIVTAAIVMAIIGFLIYRRRKKPKTPSMEFNKQKKNG